MNDIQKRIIAELRSENMRLRPLTADDDRKLAGFYAGLSPRSRQLFTPHRFDPETLKNVTADLAGSGRHRAFVLTDAAENITAYFFLWNTDEPIPVLGIAVVDACHGRGIGGRLVRFLVEEGRELGKKAIELTTGLDNDPAFHLYRKCGFEYTGDVERIGPDGKPFPQREMFYRY